MVPLQGRFTGGYYISILKKHLKRSGRKLVGQGFTFQKDNDPRHPSNKVTKWLEVENIKSLDDYPVNSPDISPIENLFALWKKKISKYRPENLKELKKADTRERKKLSPELCYNLLSSVPRGLQAVQDNHGGVNKYLVKFLE